MAWFPHIAFVLVMLVPCQNKMLREKPAAAAVRAVAPYFFALRERRRRLGERVGAGSSSRRSSPTRRSKAGRVRLGRLRDRLRAVSYRILRASRFASLEAPPAMQAAGEAQPSKVAKGSSQRIPGSKNSPSQQLATASRWVRKKVKPFKTIVHVRALESAARARVCRGDLLEIRYGPGALRPSFLGAGRRSTTSGPGVFKTRERSERTVFRHSP